MTIAYFVGGLFIGLYLLLNIGVATGYNPKEMKNEFWTEQSWCGKISANIFYAPAWLFKGLVFIVVFLIFWFFKGISNGTCYIVCGMYNYYKKMMRGN